MSLSPSDITVLVITHNEEPNIRRFLQGMAWAGKVVVVDSGSTDATLAICQEFPQVSVVHRPFDSFAGQCNFGLSQVETEWVISCDADYIAEPEFASAVQSLDGTAAGYAVPFTYCIHGRKLRSGLYPARTVLYRAKLGRYRDDGHGHKVEVAGQVEPFCGKLLHDDRKPLSRWLTSQQKYAAQEAEKLAKAEGGPLAMQDKLRKTGWAAPLVMLFYCLVWKRGLLDGWPGIYYALQRTYAELLLALEVLERRLGRAK